DRGLAHRIVVGAVAFDVPRHALGRIGAQPRTPLIHLETHVLLRFGGESDSAIPEFLFISRDAKYVRGEQGWRFFLIAMNLFDAFTPIVGAVNEALILR